MAESKVQRGQFIEYQDGELLNEDPNEGLSDEELAFRNFRDQLKAGEEMATLRVSKIPKSGISGHPTNAKSIHCFSCPLDRYSFDELLDFLSEVYGGGIYRLIAVKQGQKGTAFNRLVEIAEPKKPKPNPNGDSPHFGTVMDSVANLINQSQERTEALIARLSQGPVSGGPDPFQYMEKMVTMLATLGLVGNKGGGDASFTGRLNELTALKGFVDTLSGGGDDDAPRGRPVQSNAYDLLGKTIDTFGPAFMAAIAENKSAKHRALPAPAQIAPTTQKAPPQTAAENPMQVLKPQIETLVRNAVKGVDAEAMAQTVIAMTPQDKLSDLQAFVGAPDSVTRMAAVVPAVEVHRAWFETLRNSILAELAAPPLHDETEAATVTDAAPEEPPQ